MIPKTFVARPHQRTAIRFVLERRGAGLLADPGLGKTTVALSVYELLKRGRPDYRALVVAPLPAIYNTWPEELTKWKPFDKLSYEILHGPDKYSNARERADVSLINSENIFWLFDYINKTRRNPFHFLIIDESTMFKNWGSKRTKVLKKFRGIFDRILLLTGTPAPNGLLDLFSQSYLVDGGRALGPGITEFKNNYFYRSDYMGYNWKPFPNSQEKIEGFMSPDWLRLDRNDFFDMPELNEVVVPVVLPPDVMKIYKSLERKLFAEIDGVDVFIPSQSSVYNACRQVASGGLYEPLDSFGIKGPRNTFDLHTAKLDALGRLHDELYQRPLLSSFQFRFTIDQIKRHPVGKKTSLVDGPNKQKLITKYKAAFLRGEIPILATHPASMSHSLNLHEGPGRDIAWTSPTNNLEHYVQLNERIYRPGVDSPVNVYLFTAVDTIEEPIVAALQKKDATQRGFLNALKKYRDRKV